jgi:hypothetical protein
VSDDPTRPMAPAVPRERRPRLRRPSPLAEALSLTLMGVALLAVGLALEFGVWLGLVVVGVLMLAAGYLVDDGRRR